MSDGVRCPKGQAVGSCCAIQPSGAVFLQELLACRADVVKRVPISKHATEEETRMSAPHDRVNIRKTAWDLITKAAERLRQEHRDLTESQARVKAMEANPDAYEQYRAGVLRGDPPEEFAVTEAVEKRALTQAEYVYAKVEERGREIAIRKGISLAQGNVAAFEADPALYDAYRAAQRADERERRTAR
jgi:hypothetical protein